MGNRVEATYICPTHGPFSVIMATPPRHLDCPTCQRPGELQGCQTMAHGTTEEFQELMAHIQKIYSQKHPVPTRQSRGVQFYSYDPNNPVVRTEAQVFQDSLAIHETAQKAKMRAVLDQLD